MPFKANHRHAADLAGHPHIHIGSRISADQAGCRVKLKVLSRGAAQRAS